jgi:putative phage-type endonuclease
MADDMIQQRSPEWLAQRCGKVTASRVADVIAQTKTGWGASRATYAAQLVAERLTGVVEETYQSAAMKWGSDTEAEARDAYRFYRGVEIDEVGFVGHLALSQSGASPDGLVGEEGLVEIKCPNTATHIATLLGRAPAGKYVTQIQWQLACTGRQWCDFVSYDPRLPEDIRLFVARVQRDDQRIAELTAEIGRFLVELDDTMGQIQRLSLGSVAIEEEA